MDRSWSRVTALRRRALAYRYDFSPDANDQIIAEIYKQLRDHLEDPDANRRGLARTTAHYRAQLKLRPAWSKWIFEILAIPILPVFLAWALTRGLLKARPVPRATGGVRLVFPERFKVNPEIFSIPEDLENEGVETRALKPGFLFGRDLRCLFKLLSKAIQLGTPFPLQLTLKCAVDLSHVRGALDGLAPKWIAVYWEFSCAVSLIAAALKMDGIATYNVMHGDKNFFAKNAFFEVARCYCWHRYYVDLFKREYVHSDFKIFQNPAFRLGPADPAPYSNDASANVGLIAPALVTLSDNPQEAARIMETLAAACNTISINYNLSVRPHPIYREDFRGLRPHLNHQVQTAASEQETPRAFILRHAVLVGTSSTMLLEAAHLDRKVIFLKTPVTEDMESGHYIFSWPNVHKCEVKDLAGTVALALLSPPMPLQFQQTRKADTDLNSFGVERTFTHLSQSM